jgi:hypothetical protein
LIYCDKNLNDYNDYIQDSEAKTIKKIKEVIQKMEGLKTSIGNHYNDFNDVTVNFNYIKQFLPSFKETELTPK